MVNGSFLLDFDFDTMNRVLKHPTKNLRSNVETAREGMITLRDLMELPDLDRIKEYMRTGFEDGLGVKTYKGVISENEHRLAKELSSMYSSGEWTYRMDNKRRRRRTV